MSNTILVNLHKSTLEEVDGSGSERVMETCEKVVGDFGDKEALHNGDGLHEIVMVSASRHKGKRSYILRILCPKENM